MNWEELMQGLAAGTREFVEARVATLEARIVALEQRPAGLKYTGVWQRANEYERHDGVTHGGSLWVCVGDRARSEPGTDTKTWQLCVKAGRDGRDAK